MKEVEIHDGIANRPNCGYPHDAQPGEIISAKMRCEDFKAISKEPPPEKQRKGVSTETPFIMNIIFISDISANCSQRPKRSSRPSPRRQ